MTNYQVIEFNKDISDEFFKFCYNASLEKTQPASVNMWCPEGEDSTHTLPYILTHTNRFTGLNGKFFVLYDKKNIIGCSGVYLSNFSNNVALAGNRTWIDPRYRNLMLPREYLLPIQKEWSIKNKATTIALTFNEYNKNIITLWKRMRLGENRSIREPKHIFYNGMIEVDFPVNIQYTKQWVVYEQLDPTFVFDWTTIKWK